MEIIAGLYVIALLFNILTFTVTLNLDLKEKVLGIVFSQFLITLVFIVTILISVGVGK